MILKLLSCNSTICIVLAQTYVVVHFWKNDTTQLWSWNCDSWVNLHLLQ